MKRSVVTAFASGALLVGGMAVAAAPVAAAEDLGATASPAKGPKAKALYWAEVMYGVDGPFIEEENAIRGIPGDELPWEIKHSVRVRLGTDGRLSIDVKGLVFTDDDIVPPSIRGTNDESHFRGAVSCLSETGDEGAEQVVVMNVVTPPFPAKPNGDSKINFKLNLPESCIAPIIFILAGSEDKWFAVSGFEAEEEDEDLGLGGATEN